MKVNLSWVLILVGLLAVAACNDAAKPPVLVQNTATPAPAAAKDDHSDDGHDAPRISLADAKKAYDDGTAVIVDVRDVNAYKQERIKGSINIPIADIASSMGKLPKDKKIIVYCS